MKCAPSQHGWCVVDHAPEPLRTFRRSPVLRRECNVPFCSCSLRPHDTWWGVQVYKPYETFSVALMNDGMGDEYFSLMVLLSKEFDGCSADASFAQLLSHGRQQTRLWILVVTGFVSLWARGEHILYKHDRLHLYNGQDCAKLTLRNASRV